MEKSSPLLKLFIGFPLTGELKGALKRHPDWEEHFVQSEFGGVSHIGKYFEKSEIEPKEIETLEIELNNILSGLVPEIVLHLPKAVIFPKVLIS